MDEKRPLLHHGPAEEGAASSNNARPCANTTLIRPILKWLTLWCAFVFISYRSIRDYSWSHQGLENEGRVQKDFSWDHLPTLPDLEYRSCYGEFYCARLQLPLDYWNGTTNKDISLAVIRIPATVGVDHPEYRGPILVNPGGPGGSGVELAYNTGRQIQSIVQGNFTLANERYFDVLGFDPRGVGLTSPSVQCSGTDQQTQLWRLRLLEEGSLASSDASFGHHWAMMKATSGKCSNVGSDNIQHFLTTASVARDMLELTEASARWRARELKKIGSTIVVNPKETNLQYWGFSYGSYLGYSFAALFPDRVGRLVVDGVVDAEDYASAAWTGNLRDTEKVMDLFYHHCARVGFPTCPLATSKSSSVSADRRGTNQSIEKRANYVRDRTLAIIEQMWHSPIPVMEPYAEVVTWSDIRGLIFASLYSPIEAFPYLANVLAQLEQGNGTLMAKLLLSYHTVTCPAPYQPPDAHIAAAIPLRNATAGLSPKDPFTGSAIACSDAFSVTNTTKSEFVDKMKGMIKVSPTQGDLWAGFSLMCVGYTLRPGYAFRGPWESKTAHPLLMIGNTADPVTPLWSANKMARGFEGARVLTQNSPGHCSSAAYSSCTINYIHRYFFDGTLPDEGTVCEVENLPWGGGESGSSEASAELEQKITGHGELHKGLLASGGGHGYPHALGKADTGKLLAHL